MVDVDNDGGDSEARIQRSDRRKRYKVWIQKRDRRSMVMVGNGMDTGLYRRGERRFCTEKD